MKNTILENINDTEKETKTRTADYTTYNVWNNKTDKSFI